MCRRRSLSTQPVLISTVHIEMQYAAEVFCFASANHIAVDGRGLCYFWFSPTITLHYLRLYSRPSVLNLSVQTKMRYAIEKFFSASANHNTFEKGDFAILIFSPSYSHQPYLFRSSGPRICQFRLNAMCDRSFGVWIA
jgi:hypothetical protein